MDYVMPPITSPSPVNRNAPNYITLDSILAPRPPFPSSTSFPPNHQELNPPPSLIPAALPTYLQLPMAPLPVPAPVPVPVPLDIKQHSILPSASPCSPNPSLPSSSSPTLVYTSSLRDTIDLCRAHSSQHVRVVLVIYDLLPPGKLSDLAWVFGVGLYHTAVRIPLLGREIAFGGHPHPQLSGIFSLPVRADGRPSLPGLRWVRDIEMGEVCTQPGRTRASMARPDDEVNLIRPPPCYASPPGPSYPPQPAPRSPARSSSCSSSSQASDFPRTPSSPRTQLETLAMILDQLERAADWRGPSYDLLRRNCNTFSDELCMLLTGKRAPKWINRAAALGTALPCLVPTEWIEPPPAPTPERRSIEDDCQPTKNQMQINS